MTLAKKETFMPECGLKLLRRRPKRHKPIYDDTSDYYIAQVDAHLADQNSFWNVARDVFSERLADRLHGKSLLDVACGEGHLTRHLLSFAPRQVRGIDLSARMLEVARQRCSAPEVEFCRDDAHTLEGVPTESVDVVVSFLALMDIADHRLLFRAARRVLKQGGTLMFSTLHPCFEAPFFTPQGSQFAFSGRRKSAYIIRRYHTEGWWTSGEQGLRGVVGSYHRTLSTLVNDLMDAGFCLRYFNEPVTPTGDLFAEMPRILIMELQAV